MTSTSPETADRDILEQRTTNPFVFLGGCPRSGTTLLQRMLDHHPDLAVVNDSHFVPRALEKVSPQLYEAGCRGEMIALSNELTKAVWDYHRFYRMQLDRRTFDKVVDRSATYQMLVAGLFDAVAASQGKCLAGEKTPDYIRHAQLLKGLFPEVKLIHIVRDGRDTALSLMQWAEPHKGPGRFAWWNTDAVAVCALWWKYFVTSASEPSDTDRFCLLQYERLLEQPEPCLTKLCRFLGLPPAESMLQFHKSKSGAGNGSAKSQWLPPTKGLRDWRVSMMPEDVATFELLAGKTLAQFGYELSDFCPTVAAKRRATQALEWWNAAGPPRLKTNSRVATSADQAVIDRDSAIPGLGRLLCGERFRRLTHKQMKNAQQPKPAYVRYKPGRNCLVSFTNGKSPWGFAVAHRRDAHDKMQKASSFLARHATRPDGPGFVDRENHIVAFRYPLDPRLPALSTLHGDPSAKGTGRLVHSLCPELKALKRIEVLRYKPMRRAVLRVEDVSGRIAVLRVYAAEEHATAAFARKHLSNTDWDAARRIGHSSRHRIIATEWVDGDVIRDPSVFASTLPEIGGVLARVHNAVHPKLPVVTLDDLLHRVNASAQALTELMPKCHGRVMRLTKQIVEALGSCTSPLAQSHGDFHLGQVIKTRAGELALLDWDNACNAPPGVDLGSFAAHLMLDQLMSEQRNGRDMIERFVTGYQQRRGQLPVNFAAFASAAMLQLALHPFRLRHPDWPRVCASLLDEIRSLLDDGALVAFRFTQDSDRSLHPEVRITSGVNRLSAEPWMREAIDGRLAARRLKPMAIRQTQNECVLQQIQLVKHVTNRRCVLLYTWNPRGNCDQFQMIGKCRKKGLDLRAFDAQQRLYRATQDNCGCLRIAEPLEVIPEWNMWFQSVLPGSPADQLIEPGSRVEYSRCVGRALGELHSLDVTPSACHTFTDELEILKDGFAKVKQEQPESASVLERIQQGCVGLLDAVPGNELTGIHRDFHPAQVLCDGGHVGVVDCDLFALGDPAIDLGNYVAHLREMALRQYGDLHALEDQESAFLDGYCQMRSDVTDLSVQVMTSVSLARHIYISRRIRQRQSTTDALISVVDQQLSELCQLI